MKNIVLISGNKRSGKDTMAREFANAGYSVVINARDEAELKQAAEDISKFIKENGEVVSIPGEISQEQVCISLIEEAVKQFGRIDVLVNNAGIG